MLQVLSAAALTSYTYFFVDDWLFIAQARRTPLSVAYLREPLFEHFSPVSRLLDKLLIHDSTGSFALAHGLQLFMYAAAIAAFAVVVRTILGNRWSAFALTILFGQSLFLMRLLNWWTATANLLPSTVLGLIAFAGYLRWQRGRSPRWLIVTLACFLGSLLDYEIAMLLPAYILAVRLLVLQPGLHPRAWLAVLRDEWMVWLGFLVLELGALFNYYANYYLPLPHAPAGQVLHFLVIAVFGAFVPALFGIKNPQSSLGQQPLVIIACVLAALALIAYAIYTRPRTWRCLLAFVLIAVTTLLPVGIVRIASWGLHIGKELYYQQSLQFMFLILVALVLRSEQRRAAPRLLRVLGVRLRGAPVPTAVLGVSVVLGYGVLFVTSVRAMGNAAWEPHRSQAYVRTFQASLHDVIQHTGREPVLFNAQTPYDISENGSVPFNSYDIFFPMIDNRVRFNTVTSPMYIVGNSGALIPARFASSDAGVLTHATVQQAGRPPMAPERRGDQVCIPAGRQASSLRIPLATSQRLTASPQLPQALRLFVTVPAATSVSLTIEGTPARMTNGGFRPVFGRGASGQYVPLDLTMEARAVAILVPEGACVGSLAIGSFQLTPR